MFDNPNHGTHFKTLQKLHIEHQNKSKSILNPFDNLLSTYTNYSFILFPIQFPYLTHPGNSFLVLVGSLEPSVA